jgi:superfamily II helicase
LQLIVDAIRWWNVMGIAAPSHPQVAFVAGYSHKSGTWATYLSRLRSMGLIEGRGDLVLTNEGAAAVNEPTTPPTGESLRTAVLAKIDTPLQRILTPILEAYPNGLTHDDAGERAGYSSSSGTWATYLSRLRSLDLIDGRGELRAQDWLFPARLAA